MAEDEEDGPGVDGKSFHFNPAIEDRLIDLVRERPMLYTTHKKTFRDIQAKEMLWEEISEILNIPVIRCKQKWKGIRDYYTRRKRQGNRRADGQPKTHKERMRFHALAFLGKQFSYIKERGTSIKERVSPVQPTKILKVEVNEPTENNPNQIYPIYFTQNLGDTKIEEFPSPQIVQVESVESSSSSQIKKERAILPKHSNMDFVVDQENVSEDTEDASENFNIESSSSTQQSVVAASNASENRQVTVRENDHIDQFFAGLNVTLRTLPPALIVEAKRKLFEVMSDFEVKALQMK